MYETKLDFPREWGRGAKQRYFLELHNTRICKSLPFRERGGGGVGEIVILLLASCYRNSMNLEQCQGNLGLSEALMRTVRQLFVYLS